MKTAVLILNILGFNCISRFITGHIGTGILVLLLDIFTLLTLSIGIGWIGFIIGCIIWIVDLVKVCTNRWVCNGQYLTEWSGNGTVNNTQYYNTNYVNNNSLNNLVKKCPFCAEIIKAEAVFCRFCNNSIIEKNMVNDNTYLNKSFKIGNFDNSGGSSSKVKLINAPPINRNYSDTWECDNCSVINPITSTSCKGCGEYK